MRKEEERETLPEEGPMQYFEIAIADPAGVKDAETRVTNALLASRWAKAEVEQLRIGAIEAIVNAAKHGNKYDPAKKVRVELHIAPKRFEMTVTDEGDGFDPNTIPDPTSAEGLLRESGRGVRIYLENTFDEMRYNDKGNAVTLVRDFSRIPRAEER